MPGLGAECEIQQRVEQCGGIDGPLHHCPVGLIERQKVVQLDDAPLGQDVVEVEELKGGTAGLVEQNHEQGDQAQPKLRGAELAGAASADLHQQGPPWDH